MHGWNRVQREEDDFICKLDIVLAARLTLVLFG